MKARHVRADEHCVNRVNAFVELVDEWRVVRRRKRRVEFLDDLAAGLLKSILKPAAGFPAVSIILEDHCDAPDLHIPVDPWTEIKVWLAARHVGAREGRNQLALRQIVGRGDRGHEGDFPRRRDLDDRIGVEREPRSPEKSTESLSISFRAFAIAMEGVA